MSENLDLLKSYLELVKVPLPEWLIDHSANTTGVSPPPQKPVPKESNISVTSEHKMTQQQHERQHQDSMYPNQIVNVAYTEPTYVVDVDYVEQNNRRNKKNQVNQYIFEYLIKIRYIS